MSSELTKPIFAVGVVGFAAMHDGMPVVAHLVGPFPFVLLRQAMAEIQFSQALPDSRLKGRLIAGIRSFALGEGRQVILQPSAPPGV